MLLTLDAEPSAASARGQPERHFGTLETPAADRPTASAKAGQIRTGCRLIGGPDQRRVVSEGPDGVSWYDPV